MPHLLFFLLATLGLSLWLGFQAVGAARSHRRTAEGLNFVLVVALAVVLAGTLCYISTRRFARMEEACRQRGVSFGDLSFNEQNALWEEAKKAVGEQG